MKAAGNAGQLGARLLHNRGLQGSVEAQSFLNPELSHLSDPFRLPDMEVAVNRIFTAIGNREKIAVFGDFDVDGLTATALLLHAIRDLGGTAVAHIPGREGTGHGLDNSALSRLGSDGVSLVITVDTGSNDQEEVSHAASIDIDVIVTDHHIVEPGLKRPLALVNPHLGSDGTGNGLTGAGVAFKLAQALYSRSDLNWPGHVIALAALGTVADVGPLRGENRIIVSEGLKQLASTNHAGLSALLSKAHPNGGDLDTEALSFNIIPRLNAPGRLGEAGPSLNLLTANDPTEALVLAGQIDEKNSERRRLSQEAWDTALGELGEQVLKPALIVKSTAFRPGILGPLAGRLSGEHGCPAIAISIGKTHARASARSPETVDIHAVLATVSKWFDQWGGHARAAGFTVAIEHLDEVIDGIQKSVGAVINNTGDMPAIEADAEIGFDELGPSIWNFVKVLGPYGEKNPTPVFVTRNLQPVQVRTMGTEGRHLRLVLSDGNNPDLRTWDAIGFGLGKAPLGGGTVDAIYSLRTNTWRGRTKQELHLLDVRPSGR